MKLLIRTLIALVIFNAAIADPALAQFVSPPITSIITGNTGVGGVLMKGLPDDVVSDGRGYYSVKALYGWSGTVTPTKEGYSFEPSSKEYTALTSNLANEDYAPELTTLIIAGHADEMGVQMQGLPGNVYTQSGGFYRTKVPYGWSGTVRPVKRGYTFSPPEMIFSRTTANHTAGDFAAKPKSSNIDGTDLYGSFGSSRSRRRGTGYKPAIRSGGRKVLVIPAGEIKTEELAETIEDMHVMSHILDEGFREKRRIQGFFTDFGDFFGRDSHGAEATYLQGFGVLFVMEVNFAFSPPARKQAQDSTETTNAADSTWLKARRQVLSPGMGQEDSKNDYDNQMVEELKKELVGSLKQASNIRNVEPDEWIILTVIGGQRQFGMGSGMGLPMGGSMSTFGSSARSGASSYSSGMMGGMGGYSGGGGGFGGMISGGSSGGRSHGGMMSGGNSSGFTSMTSSAPTVLTIRAKKSDVDDFAKGALDFEQFRKKVTILMY